MPTRGLPHYWTPEQVRQILAITPAGRPWLFALLLWRSELRQAEAHDLLWRDLNFAAAAPTIKSRKGTGGGRSRVVRAHPELADAFRSVPRGRADDRVFQFSARTAARWITQGIAAAGQHLL